MSEVTERIITHKYIIIEDIGRDLHPIGYNFRSPILKPSRFPLETIRKLLTVSGVTKMSEVYELDNSLRVSLNLSNYHKDFQTLWEIENPGKIFPWANTVVEIKMDPTAPRVDKLVEDDADKTHIEIDLGNTASSSNTAAMVDENGDTEIDNISDSDIKSDVDSTFDEDSALTSNKESDESSDVSDDTKFAADDNQSNDDNEKFDESLNISDDTQTVVDDNNQSEDSVKKDDESVSDFKEMATGEEIVTPSKEEDTASKAAKNIKKSHKH